MDIVRLFALRMDIVGFSLYIYRTLSMCTGHCPAARQVNVRQPEMSIYRLQIFASGKCQIFNLVIT
jgi:hypothetical protein